MSDENFPRESVRIQVTSKAEGGSDERVDQTTKVTSFTYEDTENAADKLQVVVDNFDLAFFDNPVFAEGNVLEVAWGYEGRMAPLRTMVIKGKKGGGVKRGAKGSVPTKAVSVKHGAKGGTEGGIEGGTSLTVDALARSVIMNQEVKCEVFENMKRSDVVAQLAKAAGYGSNAQIIEDTDEVFETINQTRMTDAQFIRDLAKKEHFEFFVDFDGLHFHKRKTEQKPLRRFTYYFDERGDIITFSVAIDTKAKPGAAAGSVTAKSRDPLTKKDISVTAKNDTVDRTALSDTIKVIDKESGSKSRTSNSSNDLRHASTATSEKGVTREANGAFTKSQQSVIVITFTAVGDPYLVAKSVIELEFPSKVLSGKYYVTNVKHTLTPGSYIMEIKCRRDGTGRSGQGGAENKNDGKLNTKTPSPSGELTPSKSVDAQSGARSTTYSDTKGRGK